MSYAFFYPETNERLPLEKFGTPRQAIKFWLYRRSSWKQIKPAGKNDKATFVSRLGETVVLRKVEGE